IPTGTASSKPASWSRTRTATSARPSSVTSPPPPTAPAATPSAAKTACTTSTASWPSSSAHLDRRPVRDAIAGMHHDALTGVEAREDLDPALIAPPDLDRNEARVAVPHRIDRPRLAVAKHGAGRHVQHVGLLP